jgi:hypothetical protein
MHRFASFPSICPVPVHEVDDHESEDAGIVEVSPPCDGPNQVIALLANTVVLDILNGMESRKVGV